MKKIWIISAVILMFSSCYYDKEEALYLGNIPCDTSNVRYSVQVVQILNQYCISCHSAAAPSGGVPLETYEQVKTYTLNGQLLRSVKHTGPSPMPQNAPKLSDCKISTLELWFNAGCPNN